MNSYPSSVTEQEFNRAPMPTLEDQVVLATALGMTTTMVIPILECLNATVSVTPNARLRWILHQANSRIREGWEFADTMSTHADLLDEALITALVEGEKEGGIGKRLLGYAYSQHGTPKHLLWQTIGHSEDLSLFTAAMLEGLREHLPLRQCLTQALQGTHPEFRSPLAEVIENIPPHQKIPYLSEVLGRASEYFDRIYLNVVRAGDHQKNPQRAFALLSSP